MDATAPSAGLSPGELQRLGETLATKLPDAVIFADREGVIRHWNDSAARIFGFGPDEALGQSLDIIIPERLRQRHWDGYHHMMSTGQSEHREGELLSVPAVTKDGRKLSIQFTVAPVEDGQGGLSGVVAVLRDVTGTFEELKRLRKAGPRA